MLCASFRVPHASQWERSERCQLSDLRWYAVVRRQRGHDLNCLPAAQYEPSTRRVRETRRSRNVPGPPVHHRYTSSRPPRAATTLTRLVLRVLVSTSHAFPGVRDLALGDGEDDRGKELEERREATHDAGSEAAQDGEAADGDGRRSESEGGEKARPQREKRASDGGHGA